MTAANHWLLSGPGQSGWTAGTKPQGVVCQGLGSVLSGHPQNLEGLSKSKAKSPKVQRHQSPPSLWLITPTEGLVHFIWEDYLLLPGLLPWSSGVRVKPAPPERGKESNLARASVGLIPPQYHGWGKTAPERLRDHPRALQVARGRARILLVAASVLPMVPCDECAAACP